MMHGTYNVKLYNVVLVSKSIQKATFTYTKSLIYLLCSGILWVVVIARILFSLPCLLARFSIAFLFPSRSYRFLCSFLYGCMMFVWQNTDDCVCFWYSRLSLCLRKIFFNFKNALTPKSADWRFFSQGGGVFSLFSVPEEGSYMLLFIVMTSRISWGLKCSLIVAFPVRASTWEARRAACRVATQFWASLPTGS